MGLSIASLVAEQKREDEGFDVELRDAHGQAVRTDAGEPVTVRIVGRYSDRYRKAEAKVLERRWQPGRTPKVDREQIDKDAAWITAQCVIGWSGIDEEHTSENVERLLKNKLIREQIEQAMEKPAGFFGGASVS